MIIIIGIKVMASKNDQRPVGRFRLFWVNIFFLPGTYLKISSVGSRVHTATSLRRLMLRKDRLRVGMETTSGIAQI